MSAVELAEKRCTKCDEAKSLVEYSPSRRHRDGLHSWCKACNNEDVKRRKAERRAEMGESVWLAHASAIVRKHRERTGNAYDKEYNRARRKALAVLTDRHRVEFDHLLLLARRGEL